MAVKNYLIAGLSGAGKTTICNLLITKGYYAVDADSAIGEHINPLTGIHDMNKKQENWVWNHKKLMKILNDKTKPYVFICGGAMNQKEFRDEFEQAFWLSAKEKTLRIRLAKRKSVPKANELKQQ